MIGLGDMTETANRCAREVADMSAVPRWAESRNLSIETVEVAVALAAGTVGEIFDYAPEGEPGEDERASNLIAAVTQIFILGFELGRGPVVADSDLPDIGNVTDDPSV